MFASRRRCLRRTRPVQCPRMLAALLFAAFFVLLAVSLVFIALRGGPRGARAALQTQSPRGRRGASIVFLLLYAALGIAVPALLLTGNQSHASTKFGATKLARADKHGRDVFGAICASCHTLAAADAVGKVGPNLDQLRPSRELILDALIKGRQRGNGTMPANLLPDVKDQQDVADFVSKVAGK